MHARAGQEITIRALSRNQRLFLIAALNDNVPFGSDAAMATGQTWKLKQYFRANAFGWRASALASTRLKQALAEIQKVGRKDAILAAEGALSLAERLWPALAGVDTSSGALGSAVHRATIQLVSVIIKPEVDVVIRARWMERLYDAVQNDGVDYLARIQNHWGELCVYTELANQWADKLLPGVRDCWTASPPQFAKDAVMALSALLKAARHDDISTLLELQRTRFWHYDQFRAESLVRQGRIDEALELAQSIGVDPHANAGMGWVVFCERVLLDAGRRDEAYRRFAGMATSATTNTMWVRRVLEKYPERQPRSVLMDLMASGAKGKWFAAAKDAGFMDIALECAADHCADPATLVRAVRDFGETDPEFAMRVAASAIKGLLHGSGYDPETGDVVRAYHYGMAAAAKIEKQADFEQTLRALDREGAVADRRMMLDALRHCLRTGPDNIANVVAMVEAGPKHLRRH